MTDLRRLAEAATPGPWEAQCYDDGRSGKEPWFVDTHAYPDGPEPVIAATYPLDAADAAYIAAANPQAVLALLDRVARLEEALDRIEAIKGPVLTAAHVIPSTPEATEWVVRPSDLARFRDEYTRALAAAREALAGEDAG